MTEDRLEYNGYELLINPVPEGQFDHGDFGWALRAFRDSSNNFALVVKSSDIDQSEENKQRVRQWALHAVQERIDASNFETSRKYCYLWTGHGEPEEYDCDNPPR